MSIRHAVYGGICGAVVLAGLSWVAPKRAVSAAVLDPPTKGRFELVQLHPSSGVEWSGIIDTETGCTWVYTSQKPPTDAEVSAAPEGEQRSYAAYEQALGSNYFGIVGYGGGGPSMNLPGAQQSSTASQALFTTVLTEEFYCNQARQNALRAGAGR